jgi:hypothetical protein
MFEPSLRRVREVQRQVADDDLIGGGLPSWHARR